MKVILCARVAGGNSGDEVDHPADYARWLIEQGYAIDPATQDGPEETTPDPHANDGEAGTPGEHEGDTPDGPSGDSAGHDATTSPRTRRTSTKKPAK